MRASHRWRASSAGRPAWCRPLRTRACTATNAACAARRRTHRSRRSPSTRSKWPPAWSASCATWPRDSKPAKHAMRASTCRFPRRASASSTRQSPTTWSRATPSSATSFETCPRRMRGACRPKWSPMRARSSRPCRRWRLAPASASTPSAKSPASSVPRRTTSRGWRCAWPASGKRPTWPSAPRRASSRTRHPHVVCGPGSIVQAHQPDEYGSLEQLLRCEAFMEGLAEAKSLHG